MIKSRRFRISQKKHQASLEDSFSQKKKTISVFKKIVGITIFVIFLLLVFLLLTPIGRNLLSFTLQYFFTKSIQINKNEDASINILALGIGGGEHEGPNLTDTIIFAHIDPFKNTVKLVSIPRDIWIPDLKSKINTAYSTGESNNKQGISYSKAVFEKVLGQKIQYSIIVNFSAFTKLIDLLGGVDVDVKNSFDDFEYPIEGKENDLCGHSEDEILLLATSSSQLDAFPCRYMDFHVDKGKNHMTGETALRFVRSRHGSGSEGTDFARSARQHLVISAVREKLLSLGTILNPVKLVSIFNLLKDNINTDIPSSEFDDFIRLAQRMGNATITNTVIDNGNDKEKRPGLLINPPISESYGGAWVLNPRIGEGNFSEIQKYVGCIVLDKECLVEDNDINIKEKSASSSGR